MYSMKSLAKCVLILPMALTLCLTAFGQSTSQPKAQSETQTKPQPNTSSKVLMPKFAGSWVLNREKSEGLTGGLGNAEIRLVVTQDEKSLSAEQQTIIRNREQPSQVLNYKFDGSETEAEVVRPLAGTMKLKAKWIEGGKVLELQSTITGEAAGQQTTITTKELWQLIGNGDALKLTRTRQSPQGTQTFKLYFEKQ